MNWLNLTDFVSHQNAVFYGAALAVAAGLTLLLAAAIQQTRKLVGGLRRNRTTAASGTGQREMALGQRIDRTDEPVFAVPAAPATERIPSAAKRNRQVRLDTLAARLEALVSQLEDLQADMAANVHCKTAFSGLKAGSDGVEYLYRKEMY